jgi:putative ABC transport system permease protein
MLVWQDPHQLKQPPMFKNYFKIAWRNLFRNKVYSAINITGLAIGMAMALLIGLWINDELNVNKNFAHYDRVVRVMHHSSQNGQTQTMADMPYPLADEIRTKYASDFKTVAILSWPTGLLFSYGNVKLGRDGVRYAEPGMIEILSLKLNRGGHDALNEPATMMIDQSLANDLFGKVDPLNKAITINNQQPFRITGVFEDFPHSSEFNGLHCLISWKQVFVDNPGWKLSIDRWDWNYYPVYALLQDHADMDKLSAKMNPLLNGHGRADHPVVFLHPMSRWHLYNEFKDGKNAGGAIDFIKMFGLIGFFVLLLACINFMNLSTARSERRAREVGIRKAVGSLRRQLIFQFLGESILITTLAIGLSLVLVFISLPWFNQLTDKQMNFPWGKPVFWMLIAGFTLVTGMIAGSYPAFYLSSFDAVKVLKGTIKAGRMSIVPRKVLVVLQFTISIALIIGTLVVFQEIRLARNRPMGYERKNLITSWRSTPESIRNYDVIRNELLASRAIQDMALSISPTTDMYNPLDSGIEWPGKDPQLKATLNIIGVSQNFGKTVKWKFNQGRDFSAEFPTDSMGIVLNEASVSYMGLKNPLGTRVSFSVYEHPNLKFHVIGVIQDMIIASPFTQVKPSLYLTYFPDSWLSCITIRLNPAISYGNAITRIRPVFDKYNPAAPFDPLVNDEAFAKNFVLEERIGVLSLLFAAFAIFISCLGLFGLASFTAEQRTREIGIRKVLGASLMNLWTLLSKEYLLLIIISFCIAIPISFIVMHNWLQRYEYREAISIWIFVSTISMALFITLLTISFQSVNASLANPIKSLRTE